ncbi:RNA polymerase sigma factor [Paenibacillus typhae]|uniref:RNA polymerase sigma-70 factor, ECF subfamily n=1 Tax=Paenibacillus typhae TaxID=1174501 RepID=A0A1G9HN32_9BACL|nr:sigma-70 family RNA polymerase sigma factor [Paenibacillus typhae]SDL14144.1 RNA polymerase sigma-70 factor, ECF subfamily [Paenibacillus typhae]
MELNGLKSKFKGELQAGLNDEERAEQKNGLKNGLEHKLKLAEAMDEEQLRQIMSLYGNDIWNYIYYLTQNTEQADDLAQEVFVKCFYRIGTYRGTASLKGWLLTIARNTVFSYRKSRFFRTGLWGGEVQSLTPAGPKQQGAQAEAGRLLGTTRSAEMEYMGNQQTKDIWSIIMKLPDKLREVLVLDLKAELSINEIAGLTGLPPGTVKSRLHRARRKVQDKIRGLQ